jgi:DNA-binding response OmpR family regulator
MHIAVLTANGEQAETVRRALNQHACLVCADARQLLEHVRRQECDLVVAQWNVALADTIRAFRETARRPVPVLCLLDRDPNAAATVLRAGTSDYILNPLRGNELTVRVEALLMLAYPDRPSETLTFGAFHFDLGAERLSQDGQPLALTHKEFALALLFFRNLGKPLSRAYIQENIWTGEADLLTRTIDTHVSRVRTKLGLIPENGYRLVPVYSFGYRLEQLGQHGRSEQRQEQLA